jgi:hypothetical protein
MQIGLLLFLKRLITLEIQNILEMEVNRVRRLDVGHWLRRGGDENEVRY